MSEPITPRSQRQATKANRYKFFLGIDIGTTRTNVSYIRIIEKSRKVAQWSDVIDVGQWNPGTASVFKGPGRQVPTESLYTIRERQISHGWEATKIPITSSGDDDAVHICRAKPLSGYPEDGHWPQHLQDALKRLTKAKLIEKEEEVDIFEVNFMRWVLTRVKETLLRVGYTEDSDVEIYVCCPVAWVQKDRRRFKRNMARAAREVEMGDYFLTKQGVAFTRNGETKYDIKECDSLNRVRVLTEAEAAAIFLIATTEAQDLGILPGTTIITGDIGGGTVDFSCFQLSDDSKPRLRRQLCPPSGGSCGSLNLNDSMARFFKEKLKDKLDETKIQQYLTEIVLPHFENHIKPSFSFENIHSHPPWDFFIPAVEWHSEGTEPVMNYFRVSTTDMWEHVFEPVFAEIAELLTDQIHQARAVSPATADIWLYGGGADQPYLRPYLREKVLDVENQDNDVKLKLKDNPHPNISGTFVSKGAALAAATPEFLPERFNQTSYGFMQDLPTGPKELLSTEEAKKRGTIETLDDGGSYLPDCVRWILEYGQSYGPNTKLTPIERVDTYYDNEKTWIAKLFLVLKDDKVEQDYPISHAYNRSHTIHDIMQTCDLKPLFKDKLAYKHVFRGKRKCRQYDIRSTIEPKMIGMDLVLEVKMTSDVGNMPGTQVDCLFCRDLGIVSSVQVDQECAQCRQVEGNLFNMIVDVSSNALLEKAFSGEEQPTGRVKPRAPKRRNGESQLSLAQNTTPNSSARRPPILNDLANEHLGTGSSQQSPAKRPRLLTPRRGAAEKG